VAERFLLLTDAIPSQDVIRVICGSDLPSFASIRVHSRLVFYLRPSAFIRG